MLNNGQASGATSSLSPEQLSVLVTSLHKMKSTEAQGRDRNSFICQVYIYMMVKYLTVYVRIY